MSSNFSCFFIVVSYTILPSAKITCVMKKGVYLDTTIFSYYVDERAELGVHINRTREWWDKEKHLYDLYLSEFILLELQRGQFKKQEEALSLAKEINILEFVDDVKQIVKIYIKNKLMPEMDIGDATHLAYSSFYKIDVLLTWNCRHLANLNKKRHIKNINQSLGLFVPEIITPLELRME